MSKQKTGDSGSPSNDDGPILFELVNPQLLPTPTLINYLKSRCHLHQSITSLPRDSLLSLFLNHASPKPQRIHRDNRRGVVLKRLQNIKAGKGCKPNDANKGYRVLDKSDAGLKRKSEEESGGLCENRLLAWCGKDNCPNRHLEPSSKEGRDVMMAGKKSLGSQTGEKQKSEGESENKRPKITWP